jgi:hypothetical protein
MSRVNNAQFFGLHAPLRYGGGRRRRFVRNFQKGVVQSNQLRNAYQTFQMFGRARTVCKMRTAKNREGDFFGVILQMTVWSRCIEYHSIN